MGGITPASPLVDALPGWVTLKRAPNPGVMTLDGTNTWVLRAPGARSAIVIDPGPADEQHLADVAALGPVSFILLTHGHPDHVEGAGRLAELLGGVDVLAADPAHCSGAGARVAGARVAGARVAGARVAGPLVAGPLDRGGPAHTAGLAVTVLSTPGHTADSVCFEVTHRDERVVLTGDTILGRGTTVVAWPDGDLGAYLDSLAVLAAYPLVPALPGHGPALADCAAIARAYRSHRLARLDQVRAAVAAGDETPAQVVARVYAAVDPVLWPAAEWSVRAQLAYLDPERAGGESGSGVPGLDPL